MNGVQFVTDEKGRKVAVQLNLKKHRDLWEDIEDVLVSRSRRNEKRIPLEKVKAGPLKNASSPGELSSFIDRERGIRIARAPCKDGDPYTAASRSSCGGPRPPGSKKLRGGDKQWRIRIGNYRALYEIDDTAKTIDVTRIAHRRRVYE